MFNKLLIHTNLLRRWIVPALIAIIAVITIGGTYYYVRSTQREQLYLQASHAYETFCGLKKEVPLQARQKKAQLLIQKYPKTPYAQLVRFKLAKTAVEQNRLQEADQYLLAIMNETSDLDLAMIAKLRRARVLIAMKQFTKALQLIDHPNAGSYTTAIEEIKGDIFLALGYKTKAFEAYSAAKNALPDIEKLQPLLQMKLDDLGNIKEALPSS